MLREPAPHEDGDDEELLLFELLRPTRDPGIVDVPRLPEVDELFIVDVPRLPAGVELDTFEGLRPAVETLVPVDAGRREPEEDGA